MDESLLGFVKSRVLSKLIAMTRPSALKLIVDMT